jgi:hypothetical protein
VTLRRAVVVTGTLAIPDDSPPAGAGVGAFELDDERRPRWRDTLPIVPREARTADDRGRFRLRIDAPGRYLLVAVAPGFAPVAHRVTLAAGAPTDVGVLRLPRAATLEGTVSSEGSPLADAIVSAKAATGDEGLPVQVEGMEIHWTPGDRVVADGHDRSDERGRFCIEGLSHGPHEISVWGIDLVDQTRVRVEPDGGRAIEAPATGVRVEVGPTAFVEVHVRAGGLPVAGANVTIEHARGSTSRATGDDGISRQRVAPENDVRLKVAKDGYETVPLHLPTVAAGTTVRRTVDLEPVSEPSLVVVLTGPHARHVPRCLIDLQPLDAREPGDDDASPGRTVEAETQAGAGPTTFRVRGLAPGRHRLRVHPGAGFMEAAGYYLPVDREVALPAQGDLRVEVEASLGGRLRVAARDDAGRLLSAECRIRDATGQAREVMFQTFAATQSQASSGTLGTLSVAVVDPPLPAGTYTLAFAMDGYRSQSVDVEVRVGETRDVDVTLSR